MILLCEQIKKVSIIIFCFANIFILGHIISIRNSNIYYKINGAEIFKEERSDPLITLSFSSNPPFELSLCLSVGRF